MKGTLAVVAGCAGLGMFCVPLLAMSASADAALACLPTSVAVNGQLPATDQLDAEQQVNARIIVGTAVGRRMPTRAAVIAVATAMQESSLRNVPYGDRDSLGLFQQRPSTGWGNTVAVMDPVQSTNRFLDALQQIRGWPILPLTDAAQTVQRSAFPTAYARWEPLATRIVGSLLGRPAATAQNPRQLPDSPGLLVLTNRQLSAVSWPAQFQGGPTSVVGADSRSEVTKALKARRASLPTTVVLTVPGDAQPRRTFARFLKTVERYTKGHQVYWLTSPDLEDRQANRALRTAARTGRVELIDAAKSVARNSGWSVGDDLSSTVRAAVADLVVTAIGGNEIAPTVTGAGCDDGLGGYGRVPVADCGFALPTANPRGCQDAIRWALAQADGPPIWYRRCLNFVAQAYGHRASGIRDAATFWATATDRHEGHPDPPAGALVFWDTGQPEGHVALSAGNGLVISNDIGGAGTIALTPIAQFATQWQAGYLGWAPPFFPAAA